MSRVLAVVLGALVLVACGSAAQSDDDDGPGFEFSHRMNDGQVVDCIYYRGLSCNWEDAVP